MENKISLTFEQLESFLDQQKLLVIEKIYGNRSYYNSENTDGYEKSLPIDKDLLTELGMKTPYPNDVNILKKYIN